jgi:hypothetical protein
MAQRGLTPMRGRTPIPMPRRWLVPLLVTCTVCMCAWAPSMSAAAETAKLEVRLVPERLGAATTIEFGIQIGGGPGTTGKIPAPLTEMDLTYPAGFQLGTSELGVESCSPAALQARGPKACPPDSRMGKGSALVEVPFGSEAIKEHADVEMFMAPVQAGQVRMLFYASGLSPVIAQLVFPAVLAPAPTPSEGALDTELPLVPTFPRASDISVLRFSSTLGPLGLTYYEQVHSRTVAYRPQGVVLPKRCPRKGFPFTAELRFAGGADVKALARAPCPRAAQSKIDS